MAIHFIHELSLTHDVSRIRSKILRRPTPENLPQADDFSDSTYGKEAEENMFVILRSHAVHK